MTSPAPHTGRFGRLLLDHPAAGAVLSAVLALVLWQIIASCVNLPFLVPYPADVAVRAVEILPTGAFWASVGESLLRILGGFVLGMIAGVVLAFIMNAFPVVDALVAPFIKVIRTTPVVCFILIALLWIGSGALPVVMVALMVLPVSWTNAYNGLAAIDPRFDELARVFELSALKRLSRIRIPAIAEQLLTGAQVALGLAWKVGITTEVLASPLFGIGTQVYEAKVTLESADLFVWTIVIVILSLLFEVLMRKASAALLKRRAAR